MVRVRVAGGALACAVVAVATVGLGAAESAAQAVRIVVLKERGVGSQSVAQPYLNKFIDIAAQENGWSDAKGQYFTTRDAAEAFIATEKPRYGILSLAAFLALRTKHQLTVIGDVDSALAGGRQYFIISRSAADLAGCKGKTLASDHTDDTRFIERVVAAGQFTLKDFTLLRTQRPLQTIRQLLRDEAVCALVDDAQHGELAHIQGAAGIRAVWRSAEFPPLVIVAFPTAPAAERTRFRETLDELCDNGREGICAEVGIVSLKTTDDDAYASVIAAYGK